MDNPEGNDPSKGKDTSLSQDTENSEVDQSRSRIDQDQEQHNKSTQSDPQSESKVIVEDEENEKQEKAMQSDNSSSQEPSLNEQLIEARQLAAVKRKLKMEEELKEKKSKGENEESELRSWQPWQDPQTAQNMAKLRAQKRKEEEELRKRLLQQFADDRAERNRIPNARFPGVDKTKVRQKADAVATSASDDLQLAGNVRMQFIMPDGNRVRHNFEETQTLRQVREHLVGLIGANRNFIISSTYPLREFQEEDNDRTLSELGFVHSVVLVVRLERSGDSSDDENDETFEPKKPGPKIYNGSTWYGFDNEDFSSEQSSIETEEIESENETEEVGEDKSEEGGKFQSGESEEDSAESSSEFEEEEDVLSDDSNNGSLTDEDLPQELEDLKEDQRENNELGLSDSDSEASSQLDVENLTDGEVEENLNEEEGQGGMEGSDLEDSEEEYSSEDSLAHSSDASTEFEEVNDDSGNVVDDSSITSEAENEGVTSDSEYESDASDADNWRRSFYDTDSDDEGDPDFANCNLNIN